MVFEFDHIKSQLNKAKHGIDFVEAQELWEDENRVEVAAKKVEDENRFAVIAQRDEKLWTAIITYRGESVRLISVRRSREKENTLYES